MQRLSKRFGVPICMILNANNANGDMDFVDKDKIIMPYPCFCEKTKTCVCDDNKSPICFDDEASFDYNKHIGYMEFNLDGDTTIFDIAKKANVTASVIIRKNKLFSQKDMSAGKTLIIPVFDFETVIYHVCPGESLTDIAKKQGIDTQLIIDMNELNGIDSIYASMQLILPRNER